MNADSRLSIFKWEDKISVHLLSNVHGHLEKTSAGRRLKRGELVKVTRRRILVDYKATMNYERLHLNVQVTKGGHKWW